MSEIVTMTDGTGYMLTYNNISCKITTNGSFYMISSDGHHDYDWYDTINKYCIVYIDILYASFFSI